MTKRTFEDISEYVEYQSQYKCKVLSAKPEQTFNDLGFEVNVWNVKTDTDGAWWVVEGDNIAMNLYSQGAYYFGADEVYSFHIGIIERMNSTNEYNPEHFVKAFMLGKDIAPQLFRKLKIIADLIDSAVEIEDFQSIGVQSREVLIELGNLIYLPEMVEGEEQPKSSDFKKKTELYVKYLLKGSENSDYRSIIKKMTEATWEYASKITHSSSATFYEASTCVTLCTSLVSIYENIKQKEEDIFANYKCEKCKSKKIKILEEEALDNGFVKKIILECEECGTISEILFE